jgi:hypothetical protein
LQTRFITARAFLGLETQLLGGGDDIGEKVLVAVSRVGQGRTISFGIC